MIQDAPNLSDHIAKPIFRAAIVLVLALGAFCIWAFSAKLATTIRANGTLVSAQPAYNLQHPYGGQVAQVHVALHDDVTKGQKIITLQTDIKIDALRILTQQGDLISAENRIIRQVLQNRPIDNPQTEIAKRYQSLASQNQLDIALANETADSAAKRLRATRGGLSLLNAHQDSVASRIAELDDLLAKGLTTSQALQMDADKLFQIKGEVNASEINILTLRDQRKQAQIQAQKLAQEFRASLQTTLVQNVKQLADLERQILALRDEISRAVIVSPIDGSVVTLGFDTDQMFIPRGQTIATLSQALHTPKVQVIIPTTAVDQVYAGMRGTLTISALPQRNLPNIRVTLESVSPDAIKDETDTPIGYQATARIAQEDIANLRENLDGLLRLSTDMPVSLALEGREITFFDFLIAPFFKSFRHALQD